MGKEYAYKHAAFRNFSYSYYHYDKNSYQFWESLMKCMVKRFFDYHVLIREYASNFMNISFIMAPLKSDNSV